MNCNAILQYRIADNRKKSRTFADMKAKTIKGIQSLIIIVAVAFTIGVIAAGGYRILSLKFSAPMLFIVAAVAILILQMVRPWRYYALKILRSQRNKAIQKAQMLESTKTIIYNQTYNNNMEIIGNNISGNVYGDSATHKEIHYHFGDEGQKAQDDDNELSAAMTLLKRLVKMGKSPKETLMPYRAAIDAEVLLPTITCAKDFNECFGTDVSSSNYSTYISSDVNPYESALDEKRFRAYLEAFRRTKDNPKEEQLPHGDSNFLNSSKSS